jgi:hypothetical protein
VELVTPGITSNNYNGYAGRDTVLTIGKLYKLPEYNPHLKFTNLSDHGYILLTLTPRARRLTSATWTGWTPLPVRKLSVAGSRFRTKPAGWFLPRPVLP